MDQIKVLQFTIGGPEFTGIASFLNQYYRYMDKDRVHCDFVFGRQNSMKLVADNAWFEGSKMMELKACGKGNRVSLPKLKKGLTKVLTEGDYDVFHINTHRVGITVLCAAVARKCGVKTVISHSHNVRFSSGGRSKKRILANCAKAVCAGYIRKHCDHLFACSESAGVALFGKKGVAQSNFKVIKNAVDSASYVYDAGTREKVRRELHTEPDTFVIGQVGRLTTAKNQSFSLQVLAELGKKKQNVELWLVGDGKELSALKEKAAELSVGERVRFLGQRTDVKQLLSGMDAFIFPSVYEGLGIVAIEAQAAGLPVYASDAVPEETRITDLISYRKLSDGAAAWAEAICRDDGTYERRNTQEEVIKSGYDIVQAAKALEEFYVTNGKGNQ